MQACLSGSEWAGHRPRHWEAGAATQVSAGSCWGSVGV